jgi:Uma2 family endonuclease
MDMTNKIAQYPPRPDTSHLITEDEKPLDNRFSERQQRMLPHILFTSWHEGKPFEALTNVGLFSNLDNEDVVVPDFLLSLGIEPRPITGADEDRSYFMWVYGKAPDLVIEIVSNQIGGEITSKLEKYARIRVTYYAVYDPFQCLGKSELRLYHLVDGRYEEMTPSSFMTEIGLGLVVWPGRFEDADSRWLRFVDSQGNLIPTGKEKARMYDEQRTDYERQTSQAKRETAEYRRQVDNSSREIAIRLLAQGLDRQTILKATGVDLE